jgi:hypothetical protein
MQQKGATSDFSSQIRGDKQKARQLKRAHALTVFDNTQPALSRLDWNVTAW